MTTDAASDAFVRDRLQWQEQVLADRDLTPLALHVALVISKYLNRTTGDAWPSQGTVAVALSITPDHVRKIVRQLVAHGHLSVAVRHGRGDSNRYRMAWKTQQISGVSEARNPAKEMGIRPENPADQRGFAARNPAKRAKETQPNACLNPLKESYEGESLFPSLEVEPKRTRLAKPIASDTDFDEAYGLYPRHVGRDAARRAYAAAIGRGVPPPEILVGVRRYAAERFGEPERYTAHMASWLNAGRWADAPSRSPQPPNGGSRPPRFDPMADAARRLAEMPDD